MKKRGRKRTLVCPNCGAQYLEGRLACPECGSDELTGWKSEEEIRYQSVEIPDFYSEEEHTEGLLPKRLWLVAAIVLVAALVWWWVLGGVL